MPTVMILRIALDLVGMSLLLVALAYYWLGNAFHEIAGTGFFLMLLTHNALNRWWWAGLPRPPRTTNGRWTVIINMLLLAAMSALLVSSIMISETLFKALGLGGFTARQVHKLAAYWALAIASVHLGMHWLMVMRVARSLSRIRPTGPWTKWCFRLVALLLALQGIRSSFEMTLGSKLILHPVLDMWDFDESVVGFFVHYGSIVGLYAALGHCGVAWLRLLQRQKAESERLARIAS